VYIYALLLTELNVMKIEGEWEEGRGIVKQMTACNKKAMKQ
jgi:hypothetical protein